MYEGPQRRSLKQINDIQFPINGWLRYLPLVRYYRIQRLFLLQQESRAAARKPRDAASVLFG